MSFYQDQVLKDKLKTTSFIVCKNNKRKKFLNRREFTEFEEGVN